MKFRFLFSLVIVTIAASIFVACKHEILHDCGANPITLQLSSTVDNGTQNGTITAIASGDTSSCEYRLNTGESNQTGSFTSLPFGLYTVTATNAYGCSIKDTISVSLQTVSPCIGVTINVSLTSTNPTGTFHDGIINAVAIGGGSSYTYSISGGGNNSTGNFIGLAAGNYTITASNTNGCSGNALITLTPTIPNCTGVNISVSATPTDILPCTTSFVYNSSLNNGSIAASATGSTGFTYTMNNGISFQATGSFTSLTAGSYTIIAKDANGCTGSTTAVVAVPTKGPLFTQVRNLITSRCSGGGCHMNDAAASLYNFDDDCSIIQYKDTINSVCSSNYMPPSPFSTAEKAIITNWLNAGGKYNN